MSTPSRLMLPDCASARRAAERARLARGDAEAVAAADVEGGARRVGEDDVGHLHRALDARRGGALL
eukprot:3672370-Prymnesium_polylepis.1